MHLLESSEQDLFNTAVRGLASQGWVKCVADPGYSDRCVYNGPDGIHCAVGWCITDVPPENYDNLTCVEELLFDLYDLDLRDNYKITERHDFLSDMQTAHDQSSNGGDMARSFLAFAEAHNLGWPDGVAHPLDEE